MYVNPWLNLQSRLRRCLHYLSGAMPALLLLSAQVFVKGDFEAEIQSFETQDAASPPPSRPIVFVGSSSIKIWPNLPAAFPGLPVLNRGFGGSEMSDVLVYFDRVVARYSPSLVVLYEGDNDLAGGKSVAQVAGEYATFLDRVRQQLPSTAVMLLSVKPSPSRLSILPQMQQLNSSLKNLADAGGASYVDVHTPMLNGSGQPRPELFQSDQLHMNASGYALWQSILTPVLAPAAAGASEGGTFLFDFGAVATPVGHAPSPDDPLNFWNNVSSAGTADNGLVTNIVSIQNFPSRLGLAMIRKFNGANETGTTDPTLYPVNATRDSLYGNTEIFNNLTNIFPSFKITGLSAAAVVSLTFYASRTGVGDNRETGYTVEGANSGFAALNVANNVDQTVTVANIQPTAAGEITVSIAPTVNNNNANHFTYLGVLQVDVVPPQTPIVFTQEPVSQRAIELQPVTFTAAVEGAAPYTVQWMTNGAPVPGANQFSYTIDAPTLDLDGLLVSVTVANLAFSATSSNAVLRVVNDILPPTVVSAITRNGTTVEVVFSEPVDPVTAGDEFNYAVNDGAVSVESATLQADGRTVILTLDPRQAGTFTVTISNIQDLSLNAIVTASLTLTVPPPEPRYFLIDFGGASTTETGPSPDDPDHAWNNVTTAVGGSDAGKLLNLVAADGTVTDAGLVMIRRFNGANENGTTAGNAPFPTDATRDSLYGNTEAFNGIDHIFPQFKLTGLDPAARYNFQLYASRTGVADNRTTAYTIEGANTAVAELNVANNVTNSAAAAGILPTTGGEITISLAPATANNNANHFTYLGVLRVQLDVPPAQTPIGFTLEPVSQRTVELQPVTFTAAVTGSPPYSVQWKTNGSPVPGANAFSYRIDAPTVALDGLLVSVTVANLEFSATSSNAVLRVLNDITPPTVISVSTRSGQTIDVVFSEPVDPATAGDEFNYVINDGGTTVSDAALQPDGRTVRLTVSPRLTGTFTLVLNRIEDLSLNAIAADTTLHGAVPVAEPPVFLIDFGGANITTTGPSPDDPDHAWNNVTTAVGTSDTGTLPNLVAADGTPTTAGLVMVRRFNGANENGTAAIGTPFPTDATRDSLFGNTEAFSGLDHIFPQFKLTGLDPNGRYRLVFFASRTGVADNRTTTYTLDGAVTVQAELNAANNVTNVATVDSLQPGAGGEITISLAPAASNNNGSHFTYLGVLRVQLVVPAPVLLPPAIADGKIVLNWTGDGHLESAPAVTGPWLPVNGGTSAPYADPLQPGENRFYRVVRP